MGKEIYRNAENLKNRLFIYLITEKESIPDSFMIPFLIN